MDLELRSLVDELDRVVALWCADPQRRVEAAYVTRVLAQRQEWMALVAAWHADLTDPAAARRLGWVLAEQGGRRGSQRALDRAAELGDLPVLAARAARGGRADRARYEQARERQERTDERSAAQGDPHAAYRLSRARAGDRRPWTQDGEPLAALLRRVPELPAAGLRAVAAAGGSGAAAREIGQQLLERGAPREEALVTALPWFERADELGSAQGSAELGSLLSELGEPERAEAALRRAVGRGAAAAPALLGALLTGRTPPDWAGAAQVYRAAVERGLPEQDALAECLARLGGAVRARPAPGPEPDDDRRRRARRLR